MLGIAFGEVNIILHLQEYLLYNYKGIIYIVVSVFFSGWMISDLSFAATYIWEKYCEANKQFIY